jgi:hypothetical protein
MGSHNKGSGTVIWFPDSRCQMLVHVSEFILYSHTQSNGFLLLRTYVYYCMHSTRQVRTYLRMYTVSFGDTCVDCIPCSLALTNWTKYLVFIMYLEPLLMRYWTSSEFINREVCHLISQRNLGQEYRVTSGTLPKDVQISFWKCVPMTRMTGMLPYLHMYVCTFIMISSSVAGMCLHNIQYIRIAIYHITYDMSVHVQYILIGHVYIRTYILLYVRISTQEMWLFWPSDILSRYFQNNWTWPDGKQVFLCTEANIVGIPMHKTDALDR